MGAAAAAAQAAIWCAPVCVTRGGFEVGFLCQEQDGPRCCSSSLILCRACWARRSNKQHKPSRPPLPQQLDPTISWRPFCWPDITSCCRPWQKIWYHVVWTFGIWWTGRSSPAESTRTGKEKDANIVSTEGSPGPCRTRPRPGTPRPASCT
jgi:hypothetical protein